MSKKVTPSGNPADHVAVLQEIAIRRTWHHEKWWFSVIDVIGVLSESANANRYWSALKSKLTQEAWSGQAYEKIVSLKLAAPDRKQRDTDCANRKPCSASSSRFPHPAPSHSSAGWPRWAMSASRKSRTRNLPAPASCIRPRATRKPGSRSSYVPSPGAHRWIKGLDRVKTGNHLRDHMTDLELLFTMPGEASTTEIARRKDARGLHDNRHGARQGGAVAGNARKELEAKSGKPVVSRSNYLSSDDAGAEHGIVSKSPAALASGGARKPSKRTRD